MRAFQCWPRPRALRLAEQKSLLKLAGRVLGADKACGTPSQLISRLIPPNDPLAPATDPPPRAVLNASTVVWIDAGSVPPTEKTVATASDFEGVMTNRPARMM